MRFKRVWVLVFIFAAALCLRLALMSKGPFHVDVLRLALAAQETLETGRLHYAHGDGHPLAVLFGALSIAILKVFGVSDIVFGLNVVGVVCGALSVVLLFLVVERMFGFHTAVVAGLLLTFFPPHVAVSTFGKSLTPAMCLALASLYFLLGFIQDVTRRRDLLTAGVFLGLCGAARLSEMVFALPLGFLLLSASLPVRRRLRALGLLAFAAFATVLLFYIPLLSQKGMASLHFALTNEYQAVFLGSFSKVLPLSFAWLYSGFGLYACGLILAGIGGMVFSRRFRLLTFLILWFAVFHFLYGNLSSSGMLYLVVAWLPLLILEAHAFGRIVSDRRRLIVVSGWILLGVVCVRLMMFVPVLLFRHDHALQVDFARWVGRKTSPQGLVLAVDEGPFIEYYAKRPLLPHPIDGNPASIKRFFDETIDPLLAQGRPVYVIDSALAYDSRGIFLRALNDRYDFLDMGELMNEDWHHVLLRHEFSPEKLYEIVRGS